jgi:hypothetical protein
LTVCHSSVKALRFINVLNKVYKKQPGISPGFTFLLKIKTAEENLSLNKWQAALHIYNDLLLTYELEKDSYTSFMQKSFYSLKAKMSLYMDKKSDIQSVMRPLMHLTVESDFKLIKIQALTFIIANRYLLNIDTSYYKNAYFEFTKMVRQSGFKEESFLIRNPDMG